MTEEEFNEEKNNIKEIFEKIDVAQMYDNPEFGNPEVVQLPLPAHTMINEQIWEQVNPDLFAIFWLLSVDNVYVPVVTYEKMLETNNRQRSKDHRLERVGQVAKIKH